MVPNLVIKHKFEEFIHALLRRQCFRWFCGLIQNVHLYFITFDTPLCFVLVFFGFIVVLLFSLYFTLPVIEVIGNIVLGDFAMGFFEASNLMHVQ